MSVQGGPGRLRTLAAVARFLGVEPEEARMMVERDGMPAKRLPGQRRDRLRVFLPDLHAWLCGRKGNHGAGLETYRVFVREFDAAQELAAATEERTQPRTGNVEVAL